MVDNDPNNEEYKLDDLDLLASEPEGNPEPEGEVSEPSPEPQGGLLGGTKPWENPQIRKGLLVLGGLILVFLCYQMIRSMFDGKTTSKEIKPVSVEQATLRQPQPLQSVKPLIVDNATSKKLSSLQQTQNDMGATLQNVNGQLNSMSSEMSDLSSKITTLSANLAVLSEKLEEQTREIERLTSQNAKRQVVSHPRIVSHHLSKPAETYFIQALIPGRAWLLSSSGSSITVREGSPVAGYGVVKFIDVERGRVLMSSGRVIKFGQVDS